MLTEGRRKLRQQHDQGSPAIQVCTLLADLLDTVVMHLHESALDDLGEAGPDGLGGHTALVAHGGYGRRDVAPYSDVDLMLLHAPHVEGRVVPLARRLVMDLSDSGLDLGFSVRTPSTACTLSRGDATIFTSLVESRFLGGSDKLFTWFTDRFRRQTKWRVRGLINTIYQSRRDERRQYGETVYLLEPNLKRSRGGLRDLQLVRWIGFARYGESEPDNLHRMGVLSQNDRGRLRNAVDFLLRVRNEVHFHAGKSVDVLTKVEQLRLAELYNYEGSEAVVPVEAFMRDYFRHTGNIRDISAHFVSTARPRSTAARLLQPLFTYQMDGDFRVGPYHIHATRKGMQKLSGDLAEVLRLMDLANRANKWIAAETWDKIRASLPAMPAPELSTATTSRFLSLLSEPARLGDLLRRLHQLGLLEHILPGMAHARSLMQFNDYHKYTVDEHCILAVEKATDFIHDRGTLGEAYRTLKRKRTLHLALLVHDLGKGFTEDHSDVGLRLAEEVCQRFDLPQREAEKLKFLVHKHLIMSHLAFRRDSTDENAVVQFAVEMGTPDALNMLYLMTCADLAAVGPGVLNEWKTEVLTDLYHRSMQHLAGDAPDANYELLRRRRDKVRTMIGERPDAAWYHRQIDALPFAYMQGARSAQIMEELDRLHGLDRRGAIAWVRYLDEHHAVEATVGAYDDLTPGIFHRLTGSLSSMGLRILSADIHTLADGLVLDRFYVLDPDYPGQPAQVRLDEIRAALTRVLTSPTDAAPSFRRIWRVGGRAPSDSLDPLPTRIAVDNTTSDRFTIIDVFAHDRMGLLYTITRQLFELELSVSVAKISTHVDQVVDVFYATNQQGRKIEDERQLAVIRERLLEAIDGLGDG